VTSAAIYCPHLLQAFYRRDSMKEPTVLEAVVATTRRTRTLGAMLRRRTVRRLISLDLYYLGIARKQATYHQVAGGFDEYGNFSPA
jgi:hypothetical protein